MLRFAGRAVRKRLLTALLLLALLVLAGVGVGLYVYALRQWDAARAAVKDDRPADARGSLDFCLFFWPRSVPVHLLAARAARLRGDFVEAEGHLNECLKLRNGATEDVQVEFLLMRVQTGEEDVVGPDLIRFVENKHPETPLILETLARAYMDKLRYGPALAALDRWVQAAPDATRPLEWRGWVLERVDDPEGAMRDYRRALELSPDLVPARIRMAELLLEKVEIPEAVPLVERLNRQCPDRPDVQALLGRCRFLQGRPEEARSLLEAAATKLPDDAQLLLTLAKLDMQEGRPVEAERWVRRALKVDPTDTEAQYTLVLILQHQDRAADAAEALEQYEKTRALLRRVNALLQDEAKGRAGDPNAVSEVGALFLRAGQDRLGLYWLNKALNLDPGHQPTLEALAGYYESKGDADQAAAYRRRLTGRDPKTAAP